MDTSSSSTSKKAAITSVPHGTLGVNKDQWGPGVDAADRERFDAVLEKVLAELEPIALQEQKFCIHFFQMDVISPTARTANLDVMEKSADMSQSLLLSPSSVTGAGDGKFMPEMRCNNYAHMNFVSHIAAQFPQKKIDRQINEEVRKLMNALFGSLEQELINFIQSFERFDCL